MGDRRPDRGRQLGGPLLQPQGWSGHRWAVAAFGIGVGGYVAGAGPQSPEALDAIRRLTGWGRAVFVGIGAAIMLAYPLTEARFQKVVRQIASRRADRAGRKLPG